MAEEQAIRGLAELYPDFNERYDRLCAIYFEAREAKRKGKAIEEGLRQEAEGLVTWADELVRLIAKDREEFEAMRQKDEASFAHALRLKDDALLVRQIVAAADELRVFLKS